MKTFLTTVKGKIIAGAATGVTVAAVVVAAILLNSGYRTIAVDGLTGTTQIVNGSKQSEAYIGQHLKSGDNATVMAASDITLALDDDKYVYGEEGTHFWVEAKGKKNDTRTMIYLDKGSVLNRIDNALNEGESYQVDTPNSTMSVRGTVFRVTVYEEANGDTYTVIEVYEGSVYVQVKFESGINTDESRLLNAGESAIVRSNQNISEFIKDDAGNIVVPIEYHKLPQKSAKFLGAAIDDGRQLCIGKDLLYDYVEIIDHRFEEQEVVEEPTCTEEGHVYRVCTTCGLVEEVEGNPCYQA